MSSAVLETPARSALRRVLILADESAHWRVAGLTQLERLLFSLNELAEQQELRAPVEVCVFWKRESSAARRFEHLSLEVAPEDFLQDGREIDLVLSTRLFLHRDSLQLLMQRISGVRVQRSATTAAWDEMAAQLQAAVAVNGDVPWDYLTSRGDIPLCERRFLKRSGKSQDGLASRYVNRPLSRALSRWLLHLPITPSAWSILIFVLPICAAFAFLRGSYWGFVAGCAIFQLYSILDGCDGEIARAKFMQTEFGRRLDSFLDLLGNLLLALSLGFGLAQQAAPGHQWFYVTEGIVATLLILTSEGILFWRRSRAPSASATKWNGALYQRHHEFIERSGILSLGEKTAWWLVQLTKRDMAMLSFLGFALIGWPESILHLIFTVAGVNSVLASNAFLRQPAPAVAQEAS